MKYLRLPRARCALLLFALSSLVLAFLPSLDLGASGFFCRGEGFPLKASPWTLLLQRGVSAFLVAGLLAVLGLYVFNRVRRCNACGVDARVVCYVFTVLILGAGLIVNVVLKGSFGRARPRNVAEFGGERHFTPAFVVADECTGNCSFASGDVAGAGFGIALALALTRRRIALALAAAFVVVVAFSRIASGAHFLSDTVVSFFVMWITADVLHFYMVEARRSSGESVGARGAALPASTQAGIGSPPPPSALPRPDGPQVQGAG